MNRDKYHIIGQIQPGGWIEGGDSANWMGHKLAMSKDEYWSVEKYVKNFEREPGVWARHPYERPKSYAHFHNGIYDGNISRDQLTGIVHCLAVHRQYAALWRIVKSQAMRGFIFTNNTVRNGVDPSLGKKEKPGLLYFLGCVFGLVDNRKTPDLVLFDVWSVILRGFYPYSILLYPLIVVLDIHHLLNSVVVRNKSLEGSGDDVLSFLGKTFVSSRIMPTPLSWLANRITNADQITAKLKKYWCGWRANCDFTSVYKVWVDRYLR